MMVKCLHYNLLCLKYFICIMLKLNILYILWSECPVDFASESTYISAIVQKMHTNLIVENKENVYVIYFIGHRASAWLILLVSVFEKIPKMYTNLIVSWP